MRRQQVISARWFVVPVAVTVLFMSGFSALRRGTEPSSSIPRPESVSVSVTSSEESRFFSQVLTRDMPYTVFLPPGYASGSQRYPVLYMLHGLSGTHDEWNWYGLFETAADLMSKGDIPPFIIVLPQGDDSYWVDHDGGPRWGEYLAREVVSQVDSKYRTIPEPGKRAVGGLSMGADGALQLAMDFPGVFGVVGAHSPVLRSFETAPAYFGSYAFFEAHNPVTLARKDPVSTRGLVISIDSGVDDQWFANAEAFHEELVELGIPHEWHAWAGVHDAAYWTKHVPDDLRFYGAAFGR